MTSRVDAVTEVRSPSPRTVPLPLVLGTAAVLGILGWFVASFLPLRALGSFEFVSGYGVVDNRRLLVRYGALVLAMLAAPVVALAVSRRGFRASLLPAIEETPFAVLPASRRRRAVWWLGLVCILGFVLVGPGIAHAPLNGHELVHLGYLNEIDHGRMLNVDTRVTYGPLLGYSLYGFMKLVSFDLLGFRLYWNVLTVLFLATMLVACRGYLRHRAIWVLLAVYLIVATAARYYLPEGDGRHAGVWGWANVARQGWPPLLVLAAGPSILQGGRGWAFPAIGLACGLGAAYAQETGLPALLALSALFAAAWGKRPARVLARDLLGFAAGFLGITGAMLLPSLWRGDLPAYLHNTAEVPALTLKGGGNLAYPGILDHPGSRALLPYFVFPGVLLLFLVLETRAVLSGQRSRGVTLALAVYAALSFVNVLVRSDLLHVFNVMVAPVVLTFLYLERFASRRWLPARGLPARGAAFALLLVPLFFIGPGLPTLLGGVAGRIVHFWPGPPPRWASIPTERGGIWTPSGAWFDSPGWDGANDPRSVLLIRELAQGRPTFIQGNAASLYYFLGDAPAAVSFTDLASQCLTPADYRRLAQDLAGNRPEYVFVLDRFVGSRPTAANHYRSLGSRYGMEIFQREDLSPPAELE